MTDQDLILPEHYECGIELRVAEGDGCMTTVTLADGRSFVSDQPARLDSDTLAQFLASSSDPLGYGQLLFDTFLAGKPREGLAIARAAAQQNKKRLRLHLDIPPDARTLHTLYWEWLYDATTGTPFAVSPDISLSRFLRVNAPLGQPIETQTLKVLVVISNPVNLSEYNLPALDPAIEHQKFEEALAKVGEQVSCNFLKDRATLDNIRAQLESGHFHVLHILGHGFFKQKGYLVLEDKDGQAVFVDEGSFNDLFLGQSDLRLVVLAACVSAARSPANAFQGLGPSLVNRGVPAVVAMQRRVEIAAAQIFTEHFYRHLSQFGVIDAAVNQARYRLYLDPDRKAAGDWGIPVVFMRTEKGNLFFPTPVDVGNSLPPGLRDRFVPILREFVDREPQFSLFQKMAQRQEQERILFLYAPAGMGKSWLISKCAAWCCTSQVPWSLVDFKDAKPWDYLLALRELAPCTVDASVFSDFQNLVQQMADRNQHAFDPNMRHAVSASFIQALTRLPADQGIVLFIDTLNKAPADIRDWLWPDLLSAFQDTSLSLSHVLIILAGLDDPPPDPDRRWYHILAPASLDPLTREHFIQYARLRGFRQQDEDELGRQYDTIVATLTAITGAPASLTPLTLSLVLDRLKKEWQR